MKKELVRWQECGLLSVEQANALQSEYERYTKENIKRQFRIFLYTIGSISLGLSAFFLVLSNNWFTFFVQWLYTGTISKVIVALLCTICVYIWEYRYAKKHQLLSGSSGLFIASAICIGGTYITIAQAYNIVGGYAVFFFMWWLSIIPLALLHRSIWLGRLSILALIGAFWNRDNMSEFLGVGIFSLLSASALLYGISTVCAGIYGKKKHVIVDSYKHGALFLILATTLLGMELFKAIATVYDYTQPIQAISALYVLVVCGFLYVAWKEKTIISIICGVLAVLFCIVVLSVEQYSLVYERMALPMWGYIQDANIHINRVYGLWFMRILFFVIAILVSIVTYGRDIKSTTIAVGMLFTYGVIQYYTLDYTFYEKAFGFAVLGGVLIAVSYCLHMKEHLYAYIKRNWRAMQGEK